MTRETREKWVERIITGISAVAGLLTLIGAFYAGLAFLWLLMKAPEFCAIVIAAAMVSAALFYRKPTRIYNIQMPHPEADEMMEGIRELIETRKGQ